MEIKKKIILSLLAVIICAASPCNAGGFEEFLLSPKGKVILAITGVALGQELYYIYQNRKLKAESSSIPLRTESPTTPPRAKSPLPVPRIKTIEEQIVESLEQEALNHRFIAEVERENSNREVLQRLVSLRADVNAYNEQGFTPLFSALQQQTRGLANAQDVVSWLTAQGAKLEVQDAQGKTAFQYALESYNLVAMLGLVRMGVLTGFEPKVESEEHGPRKLDAFTVMAQAYAANKEWFQERGRLEEFNKLATDILYLLISQAYQVDLAGASFHELAREAIIETQEEPQSIARELLHIFQVNTPLINMVYRTIKPKVSESAALAKGRAGNLYEATLEKRVFFASQVRDSQEKSITFIITKAEQRAVYNFLDRQVPTGTTSQIIILGDLLVKLARAGDTIMCTILVHNPE